MAKSGDLLGDLVWGPFGGVVWWGSLRTLGEGRLGTFLGRVVSVTAGSLVWGAIWGILEVIWLGRGFLALLLLHLFICPSIHASIHLFNYLSGGLCRTSWKPLGKPLGLLGPFLGRLLGASCWFLFLQVTNIQIQNNRFQYNSK